MKIFNIILGALVSVLLLLGVAISIILLTSFITPSHIWLEVVLTPGYLIIPALLSLTIMYYRKLNNKAMFYIASLGAFFHIGNYIIHAVLI